MAETRKVGESAKQAGNRGLGRKKGVPNKTTSIAKDALAFAFDKLGGQDALVSWAVSDPDNLKIFYQTIWPKLLPLQVAGEGGGPVLTEIVRRITK